jgi:hypothetical protein
MIFKIPKFDTIFFLKNLKLFSIYTVILVRPKTGESAQLSLAPKFVGEFLLIWANFVPMSSQKFADLGKIRPNRQNFARNFLGRNLTARIRPFRTSFAQKKITVYLHFVGDNQIKKLLLRISMFILLKIVYQYLHK